MSSWFAEERRRWISETIRVFGFINREHLETKFNISTQQASLDLRAFRRLNPDVLVYDKSMKRYVIAAREYDYVDGRR